MTIAEISERSGLHRSIAYRILRTLEDHSLVARDESGKFQCGPGLAALARGVARGLQPALADLGYDGGGLAEQKEHPRILARLTQRRAR